MPATDKSKLESALRWKQIQPFSIPSSPLALNPAWRRRAAIAHLLMRLLAISG